MIITHTETIIRLVLIAVLSGVIGLEREFHRKPAGIRTNIMVGLGATLMTIASARALDMFGGGVVDPTRIAAQIITGIGFIGAGAILRPTADGSDNVVGLTTAATLWVVAGLGIAIGLGLFFEAIVATLLVVGTFVGLNTIVNDVRRRALNGTVVRPPGSQRNDNLPR